MRLLAAFVLLLFGCFAAEAQPLNNPWPGQCPAGTSASALGCFPQAATPLATDLVFGWQVAQSPKTRAMQVQQLLNSGLPGTFASLTVTGNATIGGMLGVTGATSLSSLTTSGATTVNGLLSAVGNLTVGGTLGVTGATTLGGSVSTLGKLTTAVATSGSAGFNVPPGVAPTVPGNGDIWTTATGLFVQIGSSTVGPLTANTGTVTSIATVAPLSGGTCTTTCALSLNTSGVSAATYGGPNNLPSVTFDVYGRATSAVNYPLPIVYATAHGVVCDGTTDNATALNALLTTPGTVVLPNGTCAFHSGLTLNGNGVSMVCQGWHGGTVLSFNMSTGDLITVGNGTTISRGNQIHNCDISSSVVRTAGASIHSIGVYNSHISHIYCTGSTWKCISHDGSTDGLDFANWVDHVDTEITGCLNSCLHIGGASTIAANQVADMWVADSYFGYNYTGTGIEVGDCGGCHFHDVNGSQANLGWVFDPGNGQAVGVFGDDMQADGNVNSGFNLIPTGTGSTGIDATNLWSSYNGQVAGHTSSTAVGFYLHGAGAIYGVRLANCHIGFNSSYGIFDDVATLEGAAFTGCQIGGNSQNNVNISSNVTITTGSGWSFVGGQIGSHGTSGPPVVEDSKYGVECGGSANYIVIQAVDLVGNMTAELGPGCTSVANFAIGNNL
jgi:hypothetical protein